MCSHELYIFNVKPSFQDITINNIVHLIAYIFLNVTV